MERKEKIAAEILRLKLGKETKNSQSEIQKLQQEYDSLVNENQPKTKTK
jgi:hypothetical protein